MQCAVLTPLCVVRAYLLNASGSRNTRIAAEGIYAAEDRPQRQDLPGEPSAASKPSRDILDIVNDAGDGLPSRGRQ